LLKFVDAKAFSVNITLMAASVNCHMLAVGWWFTVCWILPSVRVVVFPYCLCPLFLWLHSKKKMLNVTSEVTSFLSSIITSRRTVGSSCALLPFGSSTPKQAPTHIPASFPDDSRTLSVIIKQVIFRLSFVNKIGRNTGNIAVRKTSFLSTLYGNNNNSVSVEFSFYFIPAMFRIYRRPIVVTWYQTNSLEREIFPNKTTKRSKRKKAQSQRAGKQSKAIESSDCLSPYSGFYTVFFLIFCFLFLQGCFFFFYFVVVVVVSFVVSFLPIHAPNDIFDIYICGPAETNKHTRTGENAFPRCGSRLSSPRLPSSQICFFPSC
jgi:hypothetical protein